MAGKSDYWENGLLKLLFKATPLANIADDAASAPLTDLWVSLHTADPTDGGSQTSSEVTVAMWNTYIRKNVARGAGWTVTNNSVSPAADITFATTDATGTGCLVTHFAVGTASSGAGNLLYAGTVTPNITILPTTAGTVAKLTTASAITED